MQIEPVTHIFKNSTKKSKIFDLIDQEKQRQELTIDLIASENYASSAILQATGSVLTNKYAEGYPNRRYYGGCQIVDLVEEYANELGRKLFKAEHINLQPHSGSSANFGVYFSKLKAGDTILAMSLGAGGHLTHGHKVNFSGMLFNFVHYGVNPETEQIDFEEVERLAAQHKPKMIIAGASAYPRLMDYQKFEIIAKQHNALFLVDMAHIAGLVAVDLIPSPIPYADFVSSTTHKTLRGPRGGLIISKLEHAAILDKAIMPGIQGGPLMHVIAAKAIAFEEALKPEFRTYQEQVLKNSHVMAKAFSQLGYRIVAGGTDTHLFLVDLRRSSIPNADQLTGKLVEELLMECNIVLNRNMVPFDQQSPMLTSGIRIGTPAITTRGFKEKEIELIVNWVDQAIKYRDNRSMLQGIKLEVETLCKQFPVSV